MVLTPKGKAGDTDASFLKFDFYFSTWRRMSKEEGNNSKLRLGSLLFDVRNIHQLHLQYTSNFRIGQPWQIARISAEMSGFLVSVTCRHFRL